MGKQDNEEVCGVVMCCFSCVCVKDKRKETPKR